MDKRIKNTTDIETNNDYVVKRATHRRHHSDRYM